MQQHAGRRLIDVLAHRDETRIRVLDSQVDSDVVRTASRQAVDFVHDDEVHGVLCDELEHALQVRSISGPS
ncbi:hypothetical protein NS283_01120 [Microbacterium testaceum]|nr:hypothetical protein NS283_01120 [Microbacterium testaceum]